MSDGSLTSKSYSKYLLEQKLCRKLIGNETTDHIDENKANDLESNLQVLSREENARKSMLLHPAKVYKFKCKACGVVDSEIPYRQYKHNQLKQGKAGPYCSKKCAGKVHNLGACGFKSRSRHQEEEI